MKRIPRHPNPDVDELMRYSGVRRQPPPKLLPRPMPLPPSPRPVTDLEDVSVWPMMVVMIGVAVGVAVALFAGSCT